MVGCKCAFLHDASASYRPSGFRNQFYSRFPSDMKEVKRLTLYGQYGA